MARRRSSHPARQRVGRVSFYPHHGAWWIYYREGRRPVRRRVAETRADAERAAAQINAQLASASPTLFAFRPVPVAELRRQFLAHHEEVLHSAVSTVRRYRAATQHLADFVAQSGRPLLAHELPAEQFAAFLRRRDVSPNGHANTRRRRLRDKGVRFILEVCRSMYGYAQRMRHLPPYSPNPFAELRVDRLRSEDAKPIFVFTAETELTFLRAAGAWDFPIHFTLAKTGLRPGELTHLLIEDLDLDDGWLHVRNKFELGWRVKTGCQRAVPLVPELRLVLRAVVGARTAGPVFRRPRFRSGVGPAATADRQALARFVGERVEQEEAGRGHELSREGRLRTARTVWRDAGALKADAVRRSFIRIAEAAGLAGATCPKSWRHTFATLLQDANVDPLIRQVTLGHKPAGAGGALGMTAVYTHTRAETQQREVARAMRLWPQSLTLGAARAGVQAVESLQTAGGTCP